MTVTRTLALSNGANWRQLSDITLRTEGSSNPNRPIGISQYSVPFTLTSSIAAFYILCEDARPYWVYGGYARQTINTPLTQGNQFRSVVNMRYRLVHGSVTIQFFPNYIQEYGLIIDFPYYFKTCYLGVWEYIGDDVDLIYQNTENILTNTEEILTNFP